MKNITIIILSIVSLAAMFGTTGCGADPVTKPAADTTDTDTVVTRTVFNQIKVGLELYDLNLSDEESFAVYNATSNTTLLFVKGNDPVNGDADFNLDSKNDEILAGAGIIISYHETRPEAENGTNEQSSPYTNINFPIQTIFARVEFTSTGCFDIVPMDLVVNPTPIIPATITPIEICDVNLDGIEFFDLTERANEIYGPQDPADYALSYYTDPIDADLGDPLDAIVTPEAYQNTGNPQTIWVRLENNLKKSYK